MHPTDLPYRTLDETLTHIAAARGVAREALIAEVEQRVGDAAAAELEPGVVLVARWSARSGDVELAVLVSVTPESAEPFRREGMSVDPGDELELQLFYLPSDKVAGEAQHQRYGHLVPCHVPRLSRPVDGALREALRLPPANALDAVRFDYVSLLHQMHSMASQAEAFAVELLISQPGLSPQPIGRTHAIDFVMGREDHKFAEAQAQEVEVNASVELDGLPLQVGKVRWDHLEVFVDSGAVPDAELLAWTRRWLTEREGLKPTQFGGIVHRVDVTRFLAGFCVTVDMGSAPMAALVELVRLLRKIGEVRLGSREGSSDLTGLPRPLSARLSIASLTQDELVSASVEAARIVLPNGRHRAHDALTLAIEAPAGATLVPLGPVWQRPPGERAELLWSMLKTVRDAFSAAGTGRADQIVPLVRTAAAAAGTVAEPLTGDLVVVYAFDLDNHFGPVRPHDLRRLELDPSRLRAIAIANLRARLPPLQRNGRSGVWMLINPGSGGVYEASLLLLDDVWTALADDVKGDLVVAVPARDLLFVTGSSDAAGIERVKAMTADAFARQDNAISSGLYVRRDGAWSPWSG